MEQTTMNELEVIGTEELDLGFDLNESVDTSIKADRLMYGIAALEKKVEKEKSDKAEAEAFYQKRIDRLESQKEFLRSKIEEYLYALQQQGADARASGPNGTASLQTRDKIEWPSDDALLAWVKENGINDALKVTEKVDKTKLKMAVAVKDIPGIQITKRTGLSIRLKAKKE